VKNHIKTLQEVDAAGGAWVKVKSPHAQLLEQFGYLHSRNSGHNSFKYKLTVHGHCAVVRGALSPTPVSNFGLLLNFHNKY